MAFRFAFQAVLQFRQSVEHQQELRLRAANQQAARVRHAIEQMDRALRQAQSLSSHDLAAGTTSAELRFTLESQAALARQRQDLERELARLTKLRDQQLRIFQHARRECETLENLRDRQLQEYKRQVSRHQQRDLDDLFVLRRSYRQRG